MVATRPAACSIPVVPMVRHAAPSTWTAAQRAELAERLSKVGTTITELSDARERCGHARLSEGSDWDRAHADENLQDPEIVAAIAAIRIERNNVQRDLAGYDRKTVAAARKLLGLRCNRLCRLGELQALFNQVRVLELVAGETERQVWRAVTRDLHLRGARRAW